MNKIRLEVRSHCFRVFCRTPEVRAKLNEFSAQFVETSTFYNKWKKKFITENVRVFAFANVTRTMYQFLRTDLEKFLAHMEFAGIHRKQFDIVNVKPIPGTDCDLQMKEGFIPREKQMGAVQFISEENKHLRILQCDTGFGKTFIALNEICSRKKRAFLTMKASHIPTWLKSIKEYMGLGPGEVCVLKGSKSLRDLFALQEAGEMGYKIIIASSDTLRSYISEYQMGDFTYDVEPIDLFRYLGVGTYVKDEAHEHLHAGCTQMCHMDVDKAIMLSATLVSKNEFIISQYKRMFPASDMFESERNRHIKVTPYFFAAEHCDKLKWMGDRGYSHNALEGSILKDKKRTERYFESIILPIVEETFIRDYKEGKKCLIFASRVSMCEELAERLHKAFPEMSTASFTSETDEKVLHNTDIVCTTPQSAGTGKDIANLSHVIMTTAIGSNIQFRQIMGRLRPIKLYPEEDPHFIYFVCVQIPQHITYHKEHSSELLGNCKEFKEYNPLRSF